MGGWCETCVAGVPAECIPIFLHEKETNTPAKIANYFMSVSFSVLGVLTFKRHQELKKVPVIASKWSFANFSHHQNIFSMPLLKCLLHAPSYLSLLVVLFLVDILV